MNKIRIKIAILVLNFLLILFLYILMNHFEEKLECKFSEKNKDLKVIKSIKCLKTLFVIIGLILSLVMSLPFNFGGKIQQEYEMFVNWLSGERQKDIIIQCSNDVKNKLLQEQKIQKSATDTKDKIIEPLKEFPFSIEYDITFPETQVLEVPVLQDAGEYTVTLPIELYEYQHDKVPINEDIHGFIVNDTYYCNDDNSETSIAEFNYYNFADYWLVLHTVEVSFKGSGDFTPDFNGATIMLREKESQKAVIIEDSYLANSFVTFQCSTGQYILEIHKNGIAYTSNITIAENEKAFIGIAERDHYYLPVE